MTKLINGINCGRALLALAAAISVVLAWSTLSGGAIAGCGDGSDCLRLAQGKWAYLLGVPVSLVGIAVYVVAIFGARELVEGGRGPAALASFVCCLLGVGAAAWFMGVQAILLQAFCMWCIAAHVSAVLGVAALFIGWLRWRVVDGDRIVSKFSLGALVTASALFAGMVSIQMAGGERAAKRLSMTASLDTAVSVGPMINGKREIRLHNGRHRLDVDDYPVIGDRDAENMMVLVEDYTCGHCRALRSRLTELVRAYDGQLAVLVLPGTRRNAPESAEIQRAMLTLHAMNRDFFDVINDDLHAGRIAARAGKVIKQIGLIAGADALTEAYRENERRIEQALRVARSVQEENARQAASRVLPQLLVGQKIVFGDAGNLDYYRALVAKNLDLRMQQTGLAKLDPSMAPVLDLGPAMVDLGEVPAGKEIEVHIPLQNTGGVADQLHWAQLGQGCRLTHLPRAVEVGEEARISVNVTAPERPGAFERAVTVHTDSEPDGHTVRLVGNTVAVAATISNQ